MKKSSAIISIHTALPLGAMIAAVGCNGSPDGEFIRLGNANQSLYVLSTAVWDTNQIDVCWTTSGFETEKQWVEDTITGTWQAYINMTFNGWDACPSDMSSFKGVAITPGDEMVVRNGLGQQSDNVSDMELDFTASPQATWTRCIANSLGREDCIRIVSIHEFGHSLAFAHEQLRPDTPASCTAPKSGTPGDTMPGDYDPVSIMNYCGNGTELTSWDISGAIATYGMAPALVEVVT